MLTERMILYMTQKEFMSGSELRQYLHISTRKMKYLMDNNYIQHENTGRTTHKYRVRTEDAVRFKARMDTELGFFIGAERHVLQPHRMASAPDV